MRQQTSLHGLKAGIGPTFDSGRQPLMTESNVVAGRHGNQIEQPGPRRVVLFDDFTGDVLDDKWNAVEGTDTDATQAVLAGGIGGVLRLASGNDDANGTAATDASGVTSFLNWQAENGDLVFQTRLKVSRITNSYIFAGFTDVITAELPVISAGSGNTITTNATDGVGFMFDTNMTADNWWLVGVANDVDAVSQNIGAAPVADDYETLRIEVTAGGVATFYRNGRQVGAAMAGAVTPTVDLTPCVYVSNLDGTQVVTLDVDYIHCAMNRAADGDAT